MCPDAHIWEAEGEQNLVTSYVKQYSRPGEQNLHKYSAVRWDRIGYLEIEWAGEEPHTRAQKDGWAITMRILTKKMEGEGKGKKGKGEKETEGRVGEEKEDQRRKGIRGNGRKET